MDNAIIDGEEWSDTGLNAATDILREGLDPNDSCHGVLQHSFGHKPTIAMHSMKTSQKIKHKEAKDTEDESISPAGSVVGFIYSSITSDFLRASSVGSMNSNSWELSDMSFSTSDESQIAPSTDRTFTPHTKERKFNNARRCLHSPCKIESDQELKLFYDSSREDNCTSEENMAIYFSSQIDDNSLLFERKIGDQTGHNLTFPRKQMCVEECESIFVNENTSSSHEKDNLLEIESAVAENETTSNATSTRVHDNDQVVPVNYHTSYQPCSENFAVCKSVDTTRRNKQGLGKQSDDEVSSNVSTEILSNMLRIASDTVIDKDVSDAMLLNMTTPIPKPDMKLHSRESSSSRRPTLEHSSELDDTTSKSHPQCTQEHFDWHEFKNGHLDLETLQINAVIAKDEVQEKPVDISSCVDDTMTKKTLNLGLNNQQSFDSIGSEIQQSHARNNGSVSDEFIFSFSREDSPKSLEFVTHDSSTPISEPRKVQLVQLSHYLSCSVIDESVEELQEENSNEAASVYLRNYSDVDICKNVKNDDVSHTTAGEKSNGLFNGEHDANNDVVDGSRDVTSPIEVVTPESCMQKMSDYDITSKEGLKDGKNQPKIKNKDDLPMNQTLDKNDASIATTSAENDSDSIESDEAKPEKNVEDLTGNNRVRNTSSSHSSEHDSAYPIKEIVTEMHKETEKNYEKAEVAEVRDEYTDTCTVGKVSVCANTPLPCRIQSTSDGKNGKDFQNCTGNEIKLHGDMNISEPSFLNINDIIQECVLKFPIKDNKEHSNASLSYKIESSPASHEVIDVRKDYTTGDSKCVDLPEYLGSACTKEENHAGAITREAKSKTTEDIMNSSCFNHDLTLSENVILRTPRRTESYVTKFFASRMDETTVQDKTYDSVINENMDQSPRLEIGNNDEFKEKSEAEADKYISFPSKDYIKGHYTVHHSSSEVKENEPVSFPSSWKQPLLEHAPTIVSKSSETYTKRCSETDESEANVLQSFKHFDQQDLRTEKCSKPLQNPDLDVPVDFLHSKRKCTCIPNKYAIAGINTQEIYPGFTTTAEGLTPERAGDRMKVVSDNYGATLHKFENIRNSAEETGSIIYVNKYEDLEKRVDSFLNELHETSPIELCPHLHTSYSPFDVQSNSTDERLHRDSRFRMYFPFNGVTSPSSCNDSMDGEWMKDHKNLPRVRSHLLPTKDNNQEKLSPPRVIPRPTSSILKSIVQCSSPETREARLYRNDCKATNMHHAECDTMAVDLHTHECKEKMSPSLLKTQLCEMSESLMEMRDNLDRRRIDISILNDDLHESKMRLRDLQKDPNYDREKYMGFGRTRRSPEADSELSRVDEETIHYLERERDLLRHDARKSPRLNRGYENEVRSPRFKSPRSDKTLENLRDRIQELEVFNKSSSSEIAFAEATLESLKKENSSLRRSYDQDLIDMKVENTKMKEKIDRVNELSVENLLLASDTADLKGELSELRNEARALRNGCHELTEDNRQLKMEVRDLRRYIETISKNKNSDPQQELLDKIDYYQSEHDRLLEEIRSLKMKLGDVSPRSQRSRSPAYSPRRSPAPSFNSRSQQSSSGKGVRFCDNQLEGRTSAGDAIAAVTATMHAADRVVKDKAMSPSVALNLRDLTIDRYHKHMDGGDSPRSVDSNSTECLLNPLPPSKPISTSCSRRTQGSDDDEEFHETTRGRMTNGRRSGSPVRSSVGKTCSRMKVSRSRSPSPPIGANGYRSISPRNTSQRISKPTTDYPPEMARSLPRRAFAPRNPSDLKLGYAIKFTRPGGKVSRGTVKYVGHLPARSEVFIGVESDSFDGKHCGTFQGSKYFSCPPNKGIFTPFSKIILAWE